MELIYHHKAISQPKYQTNIVNRYAFDYLLFSIIQSVTITQANKKIFLKRARNIRSILGHIGIAKSENALSLLNWL